MQNLANGQTLFLADETTGVPVRLEIRDGKQVFVQASYVGYFVTDREIQGLPRVAEGEVDERQREDRGRAQRTPSGPQGARGRAGAGRAGAR